MRFSGHLLFARSEGLYAAEFDPERLEALGEPTPIASGVRMESFWGQAQLAVSDNGALAFVPGGEVSTGRLAWVDREGRQLGTLGAPGRYGQIALSPDERSVALEISEREGSYDIWVMDVARGVTSRVTATPALCSRSVI